MGYTIYRRSTANATGFYETLAEVLRGMAENLELNGLEDTLDSAVVGDSHEEQQRWWQLLAALERGKD